MQLLLRRSKGCWRNSMPTGLAARWSFVRFERDEPRSCRCGGAPRAFARSSANAARSSGEDRRHRLRPDAGQPRQRELESRGPRSLRRSQAARPRRSRSNRLRPDTADLDTVAAAPVPTLGFYSHVDVETKQRAEAAGLKLVVPRSRMSRELPALVSKLLGG